MSEDRLEQALEAMRNEQATNEELSRAHARILEKLQAPGDALCAEFRLQFDAYAESRLDGSRRLLMEDHLGRCPSCRARFAEQRNGSTVIPMPARRAARWPRWGSWAAAAALLFGVFYLGRSGIDTALARGPRATVASVQGNLYLIPEGILKAGASIGENQAVRTGPNSRAILRLADGSRVEINERTEVSVHAAWSGKVVHLQSGDILVQAAKQRRGYLRVQTRDALASVKGTVFAVSAGLGGSRVAVIEGSVAVAQAGSEVLLKPGEQAASNPALIGSIQEAISWSPDADTYLAILASLSKVEKRLAAIPSEPMRLQSRLLPFLPPNTLVYGAIPNIGGTIGHAMNLVEEQSAENPAFGQWWNSTNGQSLKQLLGRIQTTAHLLGNEIVFAFSLSPTGTGEKVPMILAEIQPGKRAELAAALDALGTMRGSAPLPYHLTDALMTISDSQNHLQWLNANLGKGAATPFTNEILAHYQRGTAWLLGMDMSSIVAMSGSSRTDAVGAHQLKHLFLERRDPQGIEENELTFTFKGPRMGLASFLADSGSGGAAEYLSSNVLAATYAATREPRQIFDELAALLGRQNRSFSEGLAKTESAVGIHFSTDLAAAFGTESALGIEGISTSGPVWVFAALINNPGTLDGTIHRLVQGVNAQTAQVGRNERLILEQENIDGRSWNSLKLSTGLFKATWTYDRGYMVAASDRGAALRAIAARNGGSALIWSPSFQQQLPAAAGLHPSGFAWLNTQGALSDFAGLASNPALKQILSERDPILAVFSATTEQIRASSRTRISGFMMDLMLLQSLGNSSRRNQPAIP